MPWDRRPFQASMQGEQAGDSGAKASSRQRNDSGAPVQRHGRRVGPRRHGWPICSPAYQRNVRRPIDGAQTIQRRHRACRRRQGQRHSMAANAGCVCSRTAFPGCRPPASTVPPELARRCRRRRAPGQAQPEPVMPEEPRSAAAAPAQGSSGDGLAGVSTKFKTSVAPASRPGQHLQASPRPARRASPRLPASRRDTS